MSIESLYQETRIALAHGKSTKSAVDALVERLSEPTTAVVKEQEIVEHRAFRKAGWLAAARGVLYVAVGIAVTAGTYTMGLPMLLIGWGPVIVGAITIFKGLSRPMPG